MTDLNKFWQSPIHCKLRTMLVWQEERNQKVSPHWRKSNHPWHRYIYMQTADLLRHTGALQLSTSLRVDYHAAVDSLMGIWQAGLSWCLPRYMYAADSESLVQAVARKVHLAQAKLPFMKTSELIDGGADLLVEKAGAGLFSFDAFFQIAHALDLSDFDFLYREYMARQLVSKLRQDQGASNGTYFSKWGQTDDLSVAHELVGRLELPEARMFEHFENSLRASYKHACATANAYAYPLEMTSVDQYEPVSLLGQPREGRDIYVDFRRMSNGELRKTSFNYFQTKTIKLPLNMD